MVCRGLLWFVSRYCIGGGGGNRTRVRKTYASGSTCLVCALNLTAPVQTDLGGNAAIPVSFSSQHPDRAFCDPVIVDP